MWMHRYSALFSILYLTHSEGIIAYFKICNGRIRKTGDKVKFVGSGKEYEADEIGVLKLDMVPRKELSAGDGITSFPE